MKLYAGFICVLQGCLEEVFLEVTARVTTKITGNIQKIYILGRNEPKLIEIFKMVGSFEQPLTIRGGENLNTLLTQACS